MHRIRFFLTVFTLVGVVSGRLPAQSAGVPIEASVSPGKNAAIVAAAGELKAAGKLLSSAKLAELVKRPSSPEPLVLPAPRATPLPGRSIGELARRAYVRIGWYYLCTHCDHWHINLAGGYAIDAHGTVATCHHCIKPDLEIREGYLVAVDSDDKVYAVSGVVAANERLDAAVVRVAGLMAEPLALQDQVAPGDQAYLYSEPYGTAGYFSSGIVNRFYWKGSSGDAHAFNDAVRLRMNVGTDWAPGSSGAAVLDQCGNAIGHVSTISAMGNRSGKERAAAGSGSTLITLHEAVPARGAILLLRESGSAPDPKNNSVK